MYSSTSTTKPIIINELKCFEIFLIKLVQDNIWQHITKYLTIREFVKLRILSKACKNLVRYEGYRYLCILEKQLASWETLAQQYISSHPSSSIFNVQKIVELTPQLRLIFQNETLFKKSIPEILKLPNPPMIIQHILMALFYLTNSREECQKIKDPTKWDNYKLILNDNKYKVGLCSMSITNIQVHSIDKVEELMKDITHEQVMKNSNSLDAIYNAVFAMKDFAKANKEIKNNVHNEKYYLNILHEKDKTSKKLELFKVNYTKMVPMISIIPKNLNIGIVYAIFEFLTVKEIACFRQTNKKNYSLMKEIGLNMMRCIDAKIKNISEKTALFKQDITPQNEETLNNMLIIRTQANQAIYSIDKRMAYELIVFKCPPIVVLNVMNAVALLGQRVGIFEVKYRKWPSVLTNGNSFEKLLNLNFDRLTLNDISDFERELDGITEEKALYCSLFVHKLWIWGNKVKQYVELKTKLMEESKAFENICISNEKIDNLMKNKEILKRLKIKLE